MRTIEKTLYKFEELSEAAKTFAINEYVKTYIHYPFEAEIEESFVKAEKIYNSLENIEEEISGARLYTWLVNNVFNEWLKPNFVFISENKKFINDYFSYKYKSNKIKHRKSNIFKTNTFDQCPLTGVCYDFDFLQPIFDFMQKPNSKTSNLDLAKLLPSFESICQKDYEYRTTKEYITEEFINNETEFYENGKECY